MAFDVHMLDSDESRPIEWPACQFEEPIHSAIFFGDVPVVGRYPLLLRMQDYYADARYSGAELRDLAVELQELLPHFASEPPVHQVLQQFMDVVRKAASQDKVILCLCD